MKVCIIGCGAIGSLFAAHLAKDEEIEVWAYDLDQPHIDAINAQGLRLSGVSDLVSHPHATSNPDEIPACEFGIIATKAIHTRAAIEAPVTKRSSRNMCRVLCGARRFRPGISSRPGMWSRIPAARPGWGHSNPNPRPWMRSRVWQQR